MNPDPDPQITQVMSAICLIILALWCAFLIQHAPKGEPMPGAPESYLEVTR